MTIDRELTATEAAAIRRLLVDEASPIPQELTESLRQVGFIRTVEGGWEVSFAGHRALLKTLLREFDGLDLNPL